MKRLLIFGYVCILAAVGLVAVWVAVPPMPALAATASTSAVPSAETLTVSRLTDGGAATEWEWAVDGSGDARARIRGNWVCAFTRLTIDTYNTGSLQATNLFDVYIYEIIRAKAPMTVGEVVVEYDLLLTAGTNLSNSLVNVIELRDQDGDVRFSASGEWLIVIDNAGANTEGFLRLDFKPE